MCNARTPPEAATPAGPSCHAAHPARPLPEALSKELLHLLPGDGDCCWFQFLTNFSAARGTAWGTNSSPSCNSHPRLGGWRDFQDSHRACFIPAARGHRKPRSPALMVHIGKEQEELMRCCNAPRRAGFQQRICWYHHCPVHARFHNKPFHGSPNRYKFGGFCPRFGGTWRW